MSKEKLYSEKAIEFIKSEYEHNGIFVLEHKEVVHYYLNKFFDKSGFFGVMCKDILDAEESIKVSGFENYNLFIIDSCLSTIGLRDELKAKALGGVLTGAVWIDDKINEKGLENCLNKKILLVDYMKTPEIDTWIKNSKNSKLYTLCKI